MPKTLDLTGQRFGKLVVTEKTGARNAGGSIVWKCKCDCGKTCTASSLVLRGGKKGSCGCNRKYDLTGKRFGRLTVIEEIAERRKGRVLWKCLCDCGQFTRPSTAALITGHSRSCGCVRTKHNGKGTRLYRIFTGMKDRCLNVKSKYRAGYGGRGITICEAWVRDFAVFRDWAMQNGYSEELQIDRKNNDGNYCPENCRWVTATVNSRNRRNSKLTEKDACEIKRALKHTTPNIKKLSEKYCVSTATITDIKNGLTWRDV